MIDKVLAHLAYCHGSLEEIKSIKADETIYK